MREEKSCNLYHLMKDQPTSGEENIKKPVSKRTKKPAGHVVESMREGRAYIEILIKKTRASMSWRTDPHWGCLKRRR